MADIKNFLDENGRLKSFPAKRAKKIPALVYLAGKFEPGRSYTEREVNDLLDQWHTFHDPATLRRELYDYRFIDREPSGRTYWLEPQQPTEEELLKKLS